MALIPLQKIRIVGFHKHVETLLKELQYRGVLQINETPVFKKASLQSKIELKQELVDDCDVARLAFTLKFLAKDAPREGSIGNFLTAGKLLITEQQVQERYNAIKDDLPTILTDCEVLSEIFVRNKNEIKQQKALQTSLLPYADLLVRIGEDLHTKTTETVLGRIPAVKLLDMNNKLAGATTLADMSVFYTDDRHAYLRMTYSVSMKSVIQGLLQAQGVEMVTLAQQFPGFVGKTPREALSVVQEKINDLEVELQVSEDKKIKYAQSYESLLIAYEFAVWKHDHNQVQDNFLKTKNLFAFEGWIPETKYKELALWLRNAFVGDVVVEAITPNKDEVRPALLKNRPGIAAYQMLTEMFGAPQHDEFDPTPVMAPFFGIFFGICLSDAGYGLLLMLASLPLLLFGKVSRSVKVGMSTLFVSGLMAFFGGVALGGWFALTPEQAPSFLLSADGSFIGQIINPIEGSGPLDFLLFSFVIGLIQLLIGTFLYGMKLWYNKDYVSAVCDGFLWVYFIGMLAVWGVADNIGLPKDILLYFVIAGGAAIVLTGGRKSSNIFAKIGVGLLSLYGIVDYLSATLSYSRLMALGLATGIIGFAMNLTAQVLGDVIPGVAGTIVMIFFILFGHSLNIALSFLGAFVHSMRLQFIEFFGRFYTGGAPLFAPFMRKTKYLFIRQD